jgi:hypothetical protein
MFKIISKFTITVLSVCFLVSCGSGSNDNQSDTLPQESLGSKKLAASIKNDERLNSVRAKAVQLLQKGLTAGSGYPQVWIRDLNTFVELAIETQGPQKVRAQLMEFFINQGADGNIPDGIVLSDGSTFKNTVETDQESSLVQAVNKYVNITGDTAFLSEVINGLPIIKRLENAISYVYTNRYSSQYGMIFGGTRADWGDIQPEDSPGVTMNDASHPSISIYDNAMMILALKDLQTLKQKIGQNDTELAKREIDLHGNIRRYLWTGTKFTPHIYLEKGSPFPQEFNESNIYFQGGTTVAIQAKLLEPEEIRNAFKKMIQNKIDSKSGSIGVTLFPSYPTGFFKNTDWIGSEYQYQNGGDWDWFGARTIQQMIVNGQPDLAYQELIPMLDRILKDDGFYEWYTPDGIPKGSKDYRGSAGQIVIAIDMLKKWASNY